MSAFQSSGIGFSIFVLIFIISEYKTAAQSKDYSNICTNHPPTQTSKTTNDSKWNYEDRTKERHIHLASKNARIRIASLLQGKAIVDDSKEDYSKLCAGALTTYLQGHAEVDLFGYGSTSKRADYVCAVREGKTGALDCTLIHTNGYTLNAVMYPHYETRVISTTWCFEDGEVGWLIWSTNDALTPEEEKNAMAYIGSLGFDTTDKVPMTIPSCPKKFR